MRVECFMLAWVLALGIASAAIASEKPQKPVEPAGSFSIPYYGTAVVESVSVMDGAPVLRLRSVQWNGLPPPGNGPREIRVRYADGGEARTVSAGERIEVKLLRQPASGEWLLAGSQPGDGPASGGEGGEPLRISLSTKPNPASGGGSVAMVIGVVNSSDKTVTLRFSSGQRFDITAEREGKAVWKWSRGKMFIAAIGSLSLKPGQRKEFEAAWDLRSDEGKAVAPGSYRLKAWLTAMGREKPAAPAVDLVVKRQ